MTLPRLFSVALVALSLPLASFAAGSDKDPGYFDIENLPISGKGDFVEINLSSSLLGIAGRIAADKEPEAAELLKGLKHVRVNVVKLDDDNGAAAKTQIETIRGKLAGAGWEQAVNVREANGQSVNVHIKTKDTDSIEGLVITVLEPGKDAVFVNIVGSVRVDQLAKVAAQLDIKPLKNIKIDVSTDTKENKS